MLHARRRSGTLLPAFGFAIANRLQDLLIVAALLLWLRLLLLLILLLLILILLILGLGRLEEGDLFTLEPGLYDPSEGYGVRLENLYALTADGLENLTPLPLDLDPRAWGRA